jgi:hypothetical protein
MDAKLTAYSAVGEPYHYAGGVIAPGQSVELTPAEAARGLASGAIVETPRPKAAPKPPKAPPTEQIEESP